MALFDAGDLPGFVRDLAATPATVSCTSFSDDHSARATHDRVEDKTSTTLRPSSRDDRFLREAPLRRTADHLASALAD